MPLSVAGDVSPPGDKSITHRALMLAAAARGESRLRHLLSGADCRSTAQILRALGTDVPALPSSGDEIRVPGRGLDGWTPPREVLDCGNSGTTARLMLGWLAGRPFCADFDGDTSLRARPMARVVDPLVTAGATAEGPNTDRFPLRWCGRSLAPIRHRSPVASAQIKSALLFAGVSAAVPVEVREPGRSRDHTERLLRHLGVSVDERQGGDEWWVELHPPSSPLPPLDLDIPGDPSAAAFLCALALLADRGELLIRNVCVNPTRFGFWAIIRRMGADVSVGEERVEGGEPIANLRVRASDLRAATVAAEEIPATIDEIPVLAVLAARAHGETRITGAGELRVKESDRISALVENLRALGAEADELPDGLVVRGSDRPLRGTVRTRGDHRLAMTFGMLGRLPGNHIRIDHPEAADVSFPGFWSLLDELAVHHARSGATPMPAGPAASTAPINPWASRNRPDGIIVAIDGPAGSGKSSTARAVAHQLGYRHLDSGALYRALTFGVLDAGIPEGAWEDLTQDRIEKFAVDLERTPDGFTVALGGRRVGPEIRSVTVNASVSRIAAIPAVRIWMLRKLREVGKQGGVVADGRDIGTAVFPDAELKVFLVCAPEERAVRRLLEEGVGSPTPEKVREVAGQLEERDALDSTREIAPLMRAADAILLDTTGLGFEQQVGAIVRWARARLQG